MIKYLKKRPLLIAAVCCVIVAICAFYSSYLLLLCVGLAIMVLFFAVLYKNTSLVVSALLVIISAFSGFLTLAHIDELNKYNSSTLSAKVVVMERTFENEEIYCSTVEILDCKELKKGSRISLWHKPEKAQMGDIYYTEFVVNKTLDYNKASQYSNGIYILANAGRFETLYQKDFVLSKVCGVRTYIKNTLFQNTKYSSASTLCALIMGERKYFSDEFYGNVKGAGVAHVMVVSGMHLSILVAMWIEFSESFIKNSKLKSVLTLFIVIALWSVCGFTVSILRAGITYIIMALSLWADKPYSGENALSTAVILVVIFSPFTIFNVAFQLSVLSTFGILCVALPICRYVKARKIITGKLKLYIFQSFVITFSAVVLTLPVVINIFGYVSLMSALTNLLIDHAVTGTIIITVTALLLNLVFPFGAKMLFVWADVLTSFVNDVINFIGSQEYAIIKVPKEFTFVAIGVIIGLFWILLTCKSLIDMLKLREMNIKIKNERGKVKKWR